MCIYDTMLMIKKGGIILPNLNIEKEGKAVLSAGDGALVWAAGGAGGAAVADGADLKPIIHPIRTFTDINFHTFLPLTFFLKNLQTLGAE